MNRPNYLVFYCFALIIRSPLVIAVLHMMFMASDKSAIYKTSAPLRFCFNFVNKIFVLCTKHHIGPTHLQMYPSPPPPPPNAQ